MGGFASLWNEEIDDLRLDGDVIGTFRSSDESSVDAHEGMLGLVDPYLTGAIGMYAAVVQEASRQQQPHAGEDLQHLGMIDQRHVVATFLGSTERGGTPDTLYQPGSVFYHQGNVTLYARWKKDSDVAVSEVDDDEVAIWPNPTKEEINFSLTDADDISVYVISPMLTQFRK